MSAVEVILALILTVALVAVVARLVPVAMPLLQIGAGLLLSFLPGFSRVHIDPAVFFALFIPPLLYADGWLMPRRDLRQVLRPVLALAFGLVLATVLVVGYTLHALIPSLPLAAAFALGAIVSPTDAVATAAMTERLPLPRRVTLILSGESLINDASGLVAFKFAVAAMATGMFSLAEAGADLVRVAAGGAIIGVLVSVVAGRLHSAIARAIAHAASDAPNVHTVISLLTPFAAYLAAEAVGVSGILAVVSCGLYSGWRDARHMGARTRQQAVQVWSMVLFVFNGLVFVLLGLSLPEAMEALAPKHDWTALATHAAVLWVIVTLIRLAWVYPSTFLPPLLLARLRAREGVQDPRSTFIVGWAGLRGSVTMAAALSLPVVTATGAPFPGRAEIIFLAATTILLTLLINGLSLPPLIRALGLRGGDAAAEKELHTAEIALAGAAATALREELPRLSGADQRFASHVLEQYESRLGLYNAMGAERTPFERAAAGRRHIVMLALEAERAELARLRDKEVINDETARILEPRIDYLELYAAGHTREGAP